MDVTDVDSNLNVKNVIPGRFINEGVIENISDRNSS